MHPKESSREVSVGVRVLNSYGTAKIYMEVSNGSIKGRRAESIYGRAFIGEIFDKFLPVREAEIVTWNRVSIDGKIRQIFFGRRARGEPDRRIFFLEELKADLLLPDQGKNGCRKASGSYLMPPSARDRFVSGRVPGISPDQVGGLY